MVDIFKSGCHVVKKNSCRQKKKNSCCQKRRTQVVKKRRTRVVQISGSEAHVHLLIHGFVPVQPVGGAPVVRVLQPEVVSLQQVELLAHLLEQHLAASLRLGTVE